MYRYKVTVLAISINSWEDLRRVVFGESGAVFEQYGGTVGEFHFTTPQTPADLGPLVRVELLSNDNP
jgi:hypothetical protein